MPAAGSAACLILDDREGGAAVGKLNTARFKVIADAGGDRYQFYCDLSGAHICTTGPIRAASPEQALSIAWETEGRREFNHCENCGKWVSDAMYNADVHECVECCPWENPPRYCPQCGKKLAGIGRLCPRCGAQLRYEGR